MKFFLVYFAQNPNGVEIHVDRKVTDDIKKFDCPGDGVQMQYPLTKKLFATLGVSAIHVFPYHLFIQKGSVFSWGDLLPTILDKVREALDDKTSLVEARGPVVRAADGTEQTFDPKATS